MRRATPAIDHIAPRAYAAAGHPPQPRKPPDGGWRQGRAARPARAGRLADGERLTGTQGGSTIWSGTWNGAGQLASYTGSSASMTAATYDGDGQRASITTGSGTQQFVWDTVGNVPQLLMFSQNAYIYCGGQAPTEQVNLACVAVTHLVTDSLGSVRGTVSASGSVTGTTSYDTWGNPETTGGLTSATPSNESGSRLPLLA